MNKRLSLHIFVRLALVFCVCASGLQAGPKPKDIEGTRIVTRITNAGDILEPQDVSTATIAAHVPNGAGGYTTITGVGTPTGTFTIPAVPNRSVWFQFNSTYVWTGHSKLDLDVFVYGRANAAPAFNPTPQFFNITGLSPWTSTDVLQWYSTNLESVYGYLEDFGPANQPLPGATSLAGYNLDWADTGFNLVDTNQGDGPSLTQLRSTTVSGETYTALSGIFAPASLVQLDGVANTLNGAMNPVPRTYNVRMAWKRSVGMGFQSQVNPAAVNSFQRMVVHTPPWGRQRGFIAATADLVNLFANLGSSDLDLGDATYGNPFPASGGTVYSINQFFRVSYLAPGAMIPGSLTATLATNSVDAPAAAAPLTQSLGPVTDLAVEGVGGFVSQSGLALTPHLTWTAPVVGSPKVYSVSVIRVFTSGVTPNIRTHFTTVGSCLTRETSLQLPPGLLQPGQSYIFRVRAIEASSPDPSKVPFRTNRFPFATADMVSAMVQTAP